MRGAFLSMRAALLLFATTARAVDPIRAHVITLDVYALATATSSSAATS